MDGQFDEVVVKIRGLSVEQVAEKLKSCFPSHIVQIDSASVVSVSVVKRREMKVFVKHVSGKILAIDGLVTTSRIGELRKKLQEEHSAEIPRMGKMKLVFIKQDLLDDISLGDAGLQDESTITVVIENEERGGVAMCDDCDLAEEGVDDEDRVAVYRCGDCCKDMCPHHKGVHNRSPSNKGHIITKISVPVPLGCSEHVGETLKVYCKKCDKVVCLVCALRDHATHESIIADDLKHKLQVDIESCEAHCRAVERECAGVAAAVAASTLTMHQQVDRRQEQLRGQLQEIESEELKVSRAELLSLRQCLAALTGAVGAPSASQAHVAAALRAAASREVCPCPAFKVEFKPPSVDERSLVGAVLHRSGLDLGRCELSSSTEWRAALGEAFCAVLHLRNSHGQALEEVQQRLLSTVSATLLSGGGGGAGAEVVVCEAGVARGAARGCVSVSFAPLLEHPWPLRLRIVVGDQPLPGPPPTISFVDPLWPVDVTHRFTPGGAKGQVTFSTTSLVLV